MTVAEAYDEIKEYYAINDQYLNNEEFLKIIHNILINVWDTAYELGAYDNEMEDIKMFEKLVRK
jgi:hypothetical protein